MAIEETIDVSVTGLGSVDDLAAALDKAAASMAELRGELGKGLDMSAGADKMAASYDKAFADIQAGFDKMSASMAKMGDLGKIGDAGAASLGKLDDSLKGAAAQADALSASVGKADDGIKGLGGTSDASAASVGKLDDSLKGASGTAASLKDTSAGAADGIKGIGAGADMSAAQMAEFNKVMADSAAVQARTAGVSADASLAMARSSKVQADAKASLATSSVEQDAAMAQSAKLNKAAQEDAAAAAEAGAKKHEMATLGVAAALAYGVDLAAKLQTSVTRLYTTAGESAKNLPMMTAGILALSGQTNTSQAQLGQGAYMVESAGYHGQDALGVLKAAAEGAQAEGAPLGDTANALTSLMNAYGVPKGKTASQAAMSDMDQIIAMVSRGKMTMAGAVGALPDVLPAASAAKLSFADVGGALATMTSLGASPDRGAQNLSHVITSLMNPNAVQTKEQQQLGLNPVQLQNDLGKQGLTGTLTELSSTVMHSMGPAGDVLFKTFNQSRSAAADAQTMINAMPPSIRGMAQAYADGKTSVAQWNQEMFKGTESARNKNLLQQFATTENNARGFNDLLKTGAPAVQTYAAAMDKLLGGQTGLNVAMELTGQHMPVMKANTDAIAASAQHAGANVAGWAKVQQTLNFQLGSATKSLEAVATEAGQAALPAITSILHGAGDVTGFLAGHKALTQDLMVGAGALALPAMIGKVASPVATGLRTVGTIAEKLNIPGLDKLANIGSGSGMAGAATDLTGAAGRLGGAAGSLEGAAAALKKSALGEPVPGGEPGPGVAPVTSETSAVTTTEEAAPAALTLGKFIKGAPAALRGALPAIGQGLLLGEIIRGVGDQISPAGTQAGKYNRMLQEQAARGGPASDLHPYVFGGYEGKLMQDIGLPVGRLLTGSGGTGDTSFGGGRFGALGVPAPVAARSGGSMLDMLGVAGHAGTATVKLNVTVDGSAKGKIAADLAALSSSAGMKPVKVPGPDLSALAGAKGAAAADGANVASGFAGGIAAGAGAVSAAAHSLAAAAVAALTLHLQSSSPSKVTHDIGEHGFDAGFAGGITDGTPAAIAATAALGTSSVSSLIQNLEGGSQSLQNAITALYGPLADSQAVTTIAQEIATLQAKSPGQSKWLGAQGAKLEQLANQAGALEQQITGAQSVASSVIGGASITSASGYTAAVPTAGGPQSAQALTSGMALQAQDAKQLAAALAKDAKMGLNATTLSQLAQAGVAALPEALGIAQGGKGTISQLNASEAQIIKAGGQVGNIGGPAGYQATLAANAAVGTQLKSDLAMVGKEMTKVANEVSKAVGGGAGTSSSATAGTAGSAATAVSQLASGSRAADGGLSGLAGSAHGAAGGLNAVDGAAHAAAAALASLAAAAGGGGSGSGSGSGASTGSGLMPRTGGGGGGAQAQGGPFAPGYHGISGYGQGGGTTVHQTTHVHVNVQGSVMSDQDLASHVQRALLTSGSQNWQVGIIPQGRHN